MDDSGATDVRIPNSQMSMSDVDAKDLEAAIRAELLAAEEQYDDHVQERQYFNQPQEDETNQQNGYPQNLERFQVSNNQSFIYFSSLLFSCPEIFDKFKAVTKMSSNCVTVT